MSAINNAANQISSDDSLDSLYNDALNGPQYEATENEIPGDTDLTGPGVGEGDYFGDQPQHVTRDQYLQVNKGIKDSNLGEKDKDHLLSILKDALTSDNYEEFNQVVSSLTPAEQGGNSDPLSGDPLLGGASQDMGGGTNGEEGTMTTPDSTEDDTAKYFSKPEVTLSPQFGKIKTHDIKTPGMVTIQLPNYSSTAEILKDQPAVGDYTIKAHNNGSTKAVDTETFIVHATPTTTIKIEGALLDNDRPNTVTYDGQPYSLGVDSKILVGGDSKALEGQYPKSVNDLSAFLKKNGNPDINQDQIMSAAENVGLDLNKLPATPDEKLFHFFTEIDPDLKQKLVDYNDGGMPEKEVLEGPITKRVIDLLNKLYPDTHASKNKKGFVGIKFGNINGDILNSKVRNTGSTDGGRVSSEEIWNVLQFTYLGTNDSVGTSGSQG